MKKRHFSIGPGAASLILMVVVVSMSVLGMLSLISARNDDSLTKRSMQVITENYGLNGKSERSLQALDEQRMIAAETASNDTEYMEKLGELLDQKYPGVFETDPEEMTVSWTEYSDYSVADIANVILYRVTGTDVGGRKCMNCCVRVAGLQDSRNAPVRWIVHTVGSVPVLEDASEQ